MKQLGDQNITFITNKPGKGAALSAGTCAAAQLSRGPAAPDWGRLPPAGPILPLQHGWLGGAEGKLHFLRVARETRKTGS